MPMLAVVVGILWRHRQRRHLTVYVRFVVVGDQADPLRSDSIVKVASSDRPHTSMSPTLRAAVFDRPWPPQRR